MLGPGPNMTKRILIVDDEFGLADIVAAILRDYEYEVAIAINGRLALAQLGEWRPDLILLDIMMPVLDGYETLRELRTMQDFGHVPVILMTALQETLPRDDPERHQGVLLKPFTYTDLLATVRKLLPG